MKQILLSVTFVMFIAGCATRDGAVSIWDRTVDWNHTPGQPPTCGKHDYVLHTELVPLKMGYHVGSDYERFKMGHFPYSSDPVPTGMCIGPPPFDCAKIYVCRVCCRIRDNWLDLMCRVSNHRLTIEQALEQWNTEHKNGH